MAATQTSSHPHGDATLLDRLPRWLVGDWGRWVRDPLDLMRLALLVGALQAAISGPRAEGLRLALTFVVVLLPRALNVPRPFDLAFVCGMYFQAWGNRFNAFEAIHGYDKIVHFVLPVAVSALLYLALIRLQIVPDLSEEAGVHHHVAMVILTFAFGLTVGGFYDSYEWFAIKVLGESLYANYGDTIGDLSDDALGALAAGALVVAWDRLGWGTRRRRPRSEGADAAASDPIAAAGARLLDRARPSRAGSPEDRQPVEPPSWLPVLGLFADALRVSLLAGCVYALALGHWEEAARFAITFAAVLASRLIGLPRPVDAIFTAAMAAQAWGDFATAFDTLTGFEQGVRLIVSMSAGPVLYLALIRLRAVPDFAQARGIRHRAAIALTGFALGYSAGILYELYVWVADHLLDANVDVSYTELIRRMTLDGAGALLGAALLVLWSVRGWGTTARR